MIRTRESQVDDDLIIEIPVSETCDRSVRVSVPTERRVPPFRVRVFSLAPCLVKYISAPFGDVRDRWRRVRGPGGCAHPGEHAVPRLQRGKDRRQWAAPARARAAMRPWQ